MRNRECQREGRLAFGYRVHFRLGAPLAWLETPSFVVRGPRSLWLQAG